MPSAAAPEAASARQGHQSHAIRVDPFALEREMFDDEDSDEADGGSFSSSATAAEDRARLKSREQQLLRKSAAQPQKAAAAAISEVELAALMAPAQAGTSGAKRSGKVR